MVVAFTHSYPLISSFVPIFGMKLGIIFLIFLPGYCYYFIVFSFKLYPLALLGFARIVTGNSCLAALVIGIGVLRGRL